MNLNKRYFILAATLVFSTGAAFSQATPSEQPAAQERQHRGGKGGKFHGGHRGGERLAAALNLTDAQKEQAKAIRERHRASSEGLRTDMRNLQQRYRDAKQANNTAELERLSQERQTLFTQFKDAMTAQQNEFRTILNAEQQTKFDELMAKRAERAKERGARGGKRAL